MKVLVLRNRFSHMGQHSGYDQLSEALSLLDTVSITSLWLSPKRPWRGVGRLLNFLKEHIHATPFYRAQGFQLEISAMWHALRKPTDIIHILYLEDTLGALPYFRNNYFPKVKLVATAHQPASWWKVNRLEPYWLSKLDALIVLDSVSKTYFESYIDADKIYIIPHGVAIDFFTQPTSLSSSHRCLYVGQWLRDVVFFEEVVRRVHAEAEDIFFDLVFKKQKNDATDPVLLRLAQYANVTFHPSLTDQQLADLYRQSSLLTLPLLDSTANNALLEAMASGLPIISTPVGGVEEYLPATGARLFDRHAPELFAEAILTLLKSPTERKEMGDTLRQKVEREYAWPIVAEQVKKLYTKLIQTP